MKCPCYECFYSQKLDVLVAEMHGFQVCGTKAFLDVHKQKQPLV